MAEKVKEKGKGKEKEKGIVWTEPRSVILLKICKEYQLLHGYNQTFDWVEISDEFEKKAGIKISKNCAKNKLEHMKKLWRSWCELRFKVTGAGWDSTTGMVTCDDEWWERQKQEKDDKYTQFRKKGVNPELSDLWDDVFNQIVATGRHVVSPSMDPDSVPICIGDHDGNEGGSANKDYLEIELDNDRIEDEQDLQDIVARVNLDLPYEECLASIHNTLTTPTSNKSIGASQSKGKSTRSTTSSQAVSTKRRRKQAPSTTAFNEHMALVGETSKKMLSLMEGDLGSTADAQEGKKYAYKDILVVLERMVSAELLEEESKIWCFAISQLALEHRREVFMSLPKDSNRMKWLQYEYDLAYNLYEP